MASRPWDAVGYRLINGTATSALVGSAAIWHGEKPDPTTGFPAMNFFSLPGKSLLHYGVVTSDLYQVSCRAATVSSAMDLARAVEIDWMNLDALIDGFAMKCPDVQVGGIIWEPEDEVYHVPVTLRLHYDSDEDG